MLFLCGLIHRYKYFEVFEKTNKYSFLLKKVTRFPVTLDTVGRPDKWDTYMVIPPLYPLNLFIIVYEVNQTVVGTTIS
jgi:hypothetical protein